MRLAMSTTDTDFTRSKMPSRHFSPMSPAPTISTFFRLERTFSRESASCKVIKLNLFFTPSMPSMGGSKGREPVATSNLS